MTFSWGHAVTVALVGFTGVFAILFILAITTNIIGTFMRRFMVGSGQEKKE